MNNLSHYFVAIISSLLLFNVAEPAFGSDPIEFEGLIEPYELVNVGTPVQGVVKHIKVQRSNFVEKGDALVILESSVQRAAVERARVMAAVDGEITLQQEKLAFARRMHARVVELFNNDVISVENKDQATTEVTLARNRLKKAQESRSLARLDLEHAQASLNLRTIKSPISGIIVESFVAAGEFVDDQPLLKVAKLNPLLVEVILPAKMFRTIKPGMEAVVIPEALSDSSYSSTVAVVDRVIDPASGTFGVRLELPNPDYWLPSGLRCSVRFLDEKKPDFPTEISNDGDREKVANDLQKGPLFTFIDQ